MQKELKRNKDKSAVIDIKIKLKKVLITFIILIIVSIIPALLMILNKIPFSFATVINSWFSEGTLQYFCSVLNIVASLTLGAISLFQAMDLKNHDDTRANANAYRPFFTIRKITYGINGEYEQANTKDNGFAFQLSKNTIIKIELNNCGMGPAQNLHYKSWGFGEPEKNEIVNLSIPKDVDFTLHTTLSVNENTEQNIKIYYQNILGFTYEQKIFISISPPCWNEEIEEYYYGIQIYPISSQQELPEVAYDYKLGKYCKNGRPIKDANN